MKSWTMPRNPIKSGARPMSELCADCGAPDANWASVNRGVYICNDCASVHMGLGRHISQVKHLHKSHWHPNLLNMVQHLVSAGANSVWEHSLLDPSQTRSGKRKPNPSDNIHPTKSDFIKLKYLNLAYVHRQPVREEEHHDISKQLHCSARTSLVETCLGLLSLGAHADFFDVEKGNTPLHIAAKCGQSLQVELLVAYGADPSRRDSNGKTAEEIARAENHTELADRLVELQYQVSDKFTSFLCGETPDHKAGIHYILPKIKDPTIVSPEGKKRLQALSNQMFQGLAMDVYDEIERRELERIWQDVQKNILIPGKGTNPALQTEVVPFLPLHPEYSTTRNQGRQKLAHFKDIEFNNLISDILHEIARREQIFGPISPGPQEEDPIYDIPPDDDINLVSIERSAAVETPKEMVSKEELLSLKKELDEKDAEILKLREQNRELSTKATDLARENHELTRKVQKLTEVAKTASQAQQQSNIVPPMRVGLQSPGVRPSSVFNPNDSSGSQSSLHSTESSELRRRTIHNVDHQGAVSEELQSAVKQEPNKPHSPSHCSNSSEYDNASGNKDEAGSASEEKVQPSERVPARKIETPQNNLNANNNLPQPPSAPLAQPEPDSATDEPGGAETEESEENKVRSNSSSPSSQTEMEEPMTWPEEQALMKKTELLTKMIQTLLQTAQIKKVESYLECAENILSAVSDVVALFDKPHMPAIKSIVQQLCGSAHKLRNRCRENPEQKNKAENHKQLTEEIIAYAYAIAKAEKHLVTMAEEQGKKK